MQAEHRLHRQVLEEGLPAIGIPLRIHSHAVEVVDDLVVVPDGVRRRRSKEIGQVCVAAINAIRGPIVVQRDSWTRRAEH